MIGGSVKAGTTLRENTQVELPVHSTPRIEGDSQGVTIVCRCSACWQTQERDLNDYLLKNEENFVINRNGLVLIQALADTEIIVNPA